jgi:hypothetical protein
MKKCDPIVIPKGIRFINEWEGYRLEDYPFPHILNKVLTGCGYTEYCLRNNQPLVLISPRIFLIENKEDQHNGYLEVFRVKNEVEKMTDYEVDVKDETSKNYKDPFKEDQKAERIEYLKDKIREYIELCRTNKVTPKILVTYDSFRHVKDILTRINAMSLFQVVVDEFQSIFIDARFKSTTEIELLYQLQDLQKVCFVSATPMLDRYLDMLPEFRDLPYYEFNWEKEEPERIIKPDLDVKFTTRTLNEEAGKIIHSYQEGKFDTRLGKNGVVESREAVLFFNSVAGICQAIRSNNLHIEQCNILCAKNEDNNKKVRDAFNKVLKNENPDLKVPPKLPAGLSVIGRIPKIGEPHKMFTFCTRTVYLGADFYSTNAKTFIFSDSNIDCLSVDISMDLEQILGRQRLKENPWKNYARMFVRVTSLKHKTTKEEFDKRLEEKKQNSIKLLESFTQVNKENRQVLAETYQRDAKMCHYKYNYVAVNEHAGNELVPVFNNLMMVSEMRSFEVQQIDYKDRFSVFNAINERLINSASDIAKSLVKDFNSLGSSVEKLRFLVSISERNISDDDVMSFLGIIPARFRDYYIEMGPDRIKANGCRETRLKEEWNKQKRGEAGISEELANVIFEYFKLGHRYSKSGIKETLKEMYQKYGYQKTAKASDLQEYFWTKDVKFLEDGKWVNGFEIQGKR